ncbi:MAG TPA: hypothetical protein VHS80_15805 [Chthoniobacterales bacterium]|nr:hypothetical protein [Chthoniobacterales bacterium]
MPHHLVVAVIPEVDFTVVVVVIQWAVGIRVSAAEAQWAADAPVSAVVAALEWAVIGTPTPATLIPGVETGAPGMETETGMETAALGMETETGMETEIGTDMATKGSAVIAVFPSDSFRIGIQVGGITITDIRIIGVTGTTIPITIIRTTAIRTMDIRTTAIRTTVTTLAETDQRASKC